MTLLLSVAGLYLLLYVAVLLPPVQQWLCDVASTELSRKTGGKVSIGSMRIHPFNELQLNDVSIRDPHGQPVLDTEEIGAGISLGRLIFEGKVVVTFAEINRLDAHIIQVEPGAPLNIQFLIDAFKSKEKKEPTKFDVVLNNVILRNCSVSFDKLWLPEKPGRFDINHLKVSELSADLRLPVLKNDDIKVDLRRLTFREGSGLKVNKISGMFHLSQKELCMRDVVIDLPGTHFYPGDMSFEINGWKGLDKQLLRMPLTLNLDDATITPQDFACFFPALEHYRQTVWLTVDATYYKGRLDLRQFSLLSQPGLTLAAKGFLEGLDGPLKQMRGKLPVFELDADGRTINSIVTDFVKLKPDVLALIRRLGDVKISARVEGSLEKASFLGKISTAQGRADLKADYRKRGAKVHELKASVGTDGFELGSLLDNKDFGRVSAKADADITLSGKEVSGTLTADVRQFTYKGYPYSNITADLSKQGDHVEGEVHAADPNLNFNISGNVTLAGVATQIEANADLRTLNLSAVHLGTSYDNMSLTGHAVASLRGNNLNNIEGFIEVNSLRFSGAGIKEIVCDNIYIESTRGELPHTLTVHSDYADAFISGEYDLATLPGAFKALAAHFLPDLPALTGSANTSVQTFDFSLLLKKESGLLEKIHSPVTLFEDLELNGSFDSRRGTASLLMDVPYLRQGKNKYLKDTRLSLAVDTAAQLCDLKLSTVVPNNKGDISFKVDSRAADGAIATDLNWDLGRKRAYNGKVSLKTFVRRDESSGRTTVDIDVLKSRFAVNDTVWHIEPAQIRYSDKSLDVNGVKVHRGDQWAIIQGRATASPSDTLNIDLKDIDLDYIFETLNINYVQFGGCASGHLTASRLFSKQPDIRTDDLRVRDITYNHTVLGNANIKSYFDVPRMAVYLDADIREKRKQVARIYGDIFVVGDSLNLNCDAHQVNVAFLQPFMAAFCSSVQGRASGNVHLFGTFKDIDLTGKVFADTLRMKIDVLNTYYTVRDSVQLLPGKIVIDDVKVRDRDGHTARLRGLITHEYFRRPHFDFTITDARDFLCYDTNAAINPVWYGTIYGNGSGSMHGVPGFIDIKVDMTTAPRSSFTFVLSDTEEAEAFEFLTFTDKRKEAIEAAAAVKLQPEDNRPAYLREFERKAESSQTDEPTRYAMDIRMGATPDADLTIIMDPVAGDKIRANGSGAMRMSYNSDGELDLYGTYTLTRGKYNFTMQDLIVRDFNIREGSKITFTGDPLAADLDITAAYRVNTSLTDLDKSFADDRELNRTNVPVEALLMVRGPMQSPDITFDIELPTLTEDVARKVKSIISTTDMMNRQIVYLLALNRFYTPDYMGTSGSNNELASVASTTLSTQLSSILGELTPGWTFSPNFRTEKGDFSDMEVDLALSSSLLNNRLILNGNLGYRDKATSSTTFIGDFDIEYLLNRSGSLRLKAYNHFNDQNYYLRSALTTQGVGIMFKRDFDRFLPGLFRRFRKQKSPLPKKKTEPLKQPAVKAYKEEDIDD